MNVICAAGLRSLLLLGVVIGIAGCGGSGDQLQLAPVSGMVTVNGQPLTVGTVYLIPDGSKGTKGPLALGRLDDKGRFELRSAEERRGAVVGFHKVRVEVPNAANSEGPVPDSAPTVDLSRYNDPETSGLTFEVKAGEDNSAAFDLTAPTGS